MKKFLLLTSLSLLGFGMMMAEAPRRIPHASETALTTPPDGVLHPNCRKNSYRMYRDERSGQGSGSFKENTVLRILEGSDGNLYLYRPFSQHTSGHWVKLDNIGNDQYVMKGMQYDGVKIDDTELYYCGMELHQKPEGGTVYRPTTDEAGNPTGDLTFTYRDGHLIMTDLVLDDPNATYPNQILALTDGDGSRWMWVGEAYISVEVIEDEIVSLPEDAEMSRVYMTYASTAESSQQIDAIFTEDEVYLVNPYTWNPDQWIKGYVQDDKIVFFPQYLGGDIDMQKHFWFLPGEFQETVDGYSVNPLEYVALDYDPERHIIKSGSDDVFMISQAPDHYEPEFLFYDFTISEIPDVPGTPEGVLELSATRYSSTYGNGQIYIRLSELTEDGAHMNTNKLYYNVFLDTEDNVITATTDKYTGLEEDMTDIPYRYTNGESITISFGYRVFNFYITAYDRFGVQAIYRNGGEEHRSGIYWTDGEVTPCAVDTTGNETEVVCSRIYNMQGLPVLQPKKGEICVRVSEMTDGSVKTEKYIAE